MLMQDHLYKDFVKMEKENEELKKSATAKAQDAEEQLQAQRKKVQSLEDLVQQLERGSNTESTKELVELAQQNTLLEMRLITATRKYQNLEDKEKLLRRNHDMVHAQMSEMQVDCEERINELKAWKRNAIFQMKGVYEQLHTAYPEAEYQKLEDELKTMKNKYADQLNSIQEKTKELLEVKKEARRDKEVADECQDDLEYKDDLEKQYNILSARLCNFDKKYRYEQDLIGKMVNRLRTSNVSVVKAFETFDNDGDGYIDRSEMANAIRMMGFDDMSIDDVEMLIDMMDTDKNGLIEYKEFKFMLERQGLKTRTLEETMVFNMIKAM